MADNAAHIQAIDAAIASGARSVTIDGQTVNYRSLAEMNQTRKQLVDADTSGRYENEKRKRRPFRGIDLSGAAG